MKKYIALLRGVNISGKNRIAMSELKLGFVKLGYDDALTYLNSGNVIFSAIEEEKNVLADKIKSMIQGQFGLDIPVFVILQEKLQDILRHAPDWWGTDDKEIYDNLILVMPNFTAEIIAEKIGAPTEELEQIYIYHDVIFWSFDRTNYAKANWWKKTASVGVGQAITIRTANTLKKLANSNVFTGDNVDASIASGADLMVSGQSLSGNVTIAQKFKGGEPTLNIKSNQGNITVK